MSDINLIISATDSASPVLKRINRQVDQFNRNGAKAQKSGRALSGALKGIGLAAAAIGLGKLASGVVGTIAKFESLKASLKTVTGSAEGAMVAFDQIKRFTAETPFQLDEVTNAFTILKRNGIDTSSESLKAFGNIAAANGKSFEQLAEAVADGLTGEFERLKEFGIKVRKENDQFVASMGDTQVAASGSAKELMESLKSLGQEGGRYATGLSDQAATLGGKFSNLKDNFSQFAAAIGEGGLNSALKGVLDTFNGLMTSAPQVGRMIGAGLGAAINVVMKRFSDLGTIANAVFETMTNFVTKEGGIADTITRAFDALVNDVKFYLKSILDYFGISFTDIPNMLKKSVNFMISSYQYFYESVWKIITKMPEIFRQVFLGIGRLSIDFGNRLVDQFSNIGEAAKMALQAPFTDVTFEDALNKLTTNAFKDFNLGDAFDLPTDVFLTQEDVNRIYGQDYFELAKDAIVNSSQEVQDALAGLGITVDGFSPSTMSGATGFIDEFNRLVAEGAAEQEALEAALAASTSATTTNTAATDKNNRSKSTALTYAQKLAKAYKDVIATVTKTTEQDKIQADLLPKINQAYADGTINLSQYSEALTKVGSNFEPLQVKAQRTADTIKQSMAQMSGAITDQFFDMFTGVTSVFEGLANIAKMVLQMVMKAVIQAFIVKPLLAMMGIPMFANGGIASAGQPAIVGENGPELIVPNRDSRIFSNSQTKSMLNNQANSSVSTPMSGNSQKTIEITKEPLTVNFNLTSVDTKSGVQFLLENKQTITGMVQSAYNQRGVRGPLG